MVASIHGLRPFSPSLFRIGLAPKGEPTPQPAHRRLLPWMRAEPTAPLFFAVGSLGSGRGGHSLEYAFADEQGEIVLRTFAADSRLTEVCRDARLVAFQRVLQGGLLPDGALAAARSVDCAWRRFRRTARRRGLRLAAGEPLDLIDCLSRAGLPPPALDDAASRALATRSLWRWMDGVR